MTEQRLCPDCHGAGRTVGNHETVGRVWVACEKCKGLGWVTVDTEQSEPDRTEAPPDA